MSFEYNIEEDLIIISKQEDVLQFENFNSETAWNLGCALKAMCKANKVAVTIEIRLGRETVFFYSMSGIPPNNADWARRKRNTTEQFQQSSYAVGLALARDSETLQTLPGLPARDYASHGGSFPIRVKGTGFVGAATISGLPQREDHNYIVMAIAELLQKSVVGLLLKI